MTFAAYTTGWIIRWLKVCHERVACHYDGEFIVIEVVLVN